MSEDLKPCNKCGRAPNRWILKWDKYTEPDILYFCFCSIAPEPSKEDFAIQKWNKQQNIDPFEQQDRENHT